MFCCVFKLPNQFHFRGVCVGRATFQMTTFQIPSVCRGTVELHRLINPHMLCSSLVMIASQQSYCISPPWPIETHVCQPVAWVWPGWPSPLTVVLHRAIYPHLRQGPCGSCPGPRWRGEDWGRVGGRFLGGFYIRKPNQT